MKQIIDPYDYRVSVTGLSDRIFYGNSRYLEGSNSRAEALKHSAKVNGTVTVLKNGNPVFRIIPS